jgi:hypothetical protein
MFFVFDLRDEMKPQIFGTIYFNCVRNIPSALAPLALPLTGHTLSFIDWTGSKRRL